MASTGTPATALLQREGVPFTLHSYAVDPRAESYGTAAAAALGVEPERVFKTLVASLDGRLVVGVVPVSGSLDLKALATALRGKRAVMAEPAAAERATGYVTGGISPFGQRSTLPTAVDETVVLFPTVFVSAGRRGLQVEVGYEDLLRLTGATMAPIAAG